jgi:hypothetical protein
MLRMFHTYVTRVCSKYFNCFNLYVAISVFMSQVASVLPRMLHMFHTHISSICVKYFMCFRRMLHRGVSYFREVERVMEAQPKRWGIGRSKPGLADGVCWGPEVRVREAPRVMRTGRAHPHPCSQVPPVLRERRGSGGRSGGRGEDTRAS